MSEYAGFIYYIDERERAKRLADSIGYTHNEFTDVISAADFHPKQAEIFLISIDGSTVEMAALVRKTRRVATNKDGIRFSHIVRFDPIALDKIEAGLNARIKQHFSRAMSGITIRLTPRTWQGVWDALRRERPNTIAAFDDLERRRLLKPILILNSERQAIAYEKDAAMVALRLAGIDPAEFVNRMQPEEGLSIFSGIKVANLTEDQMIIHDSSIFSNWDLVHRSRVGEAIFSRGGRTLTVMDVNRTSIENTLGVDLVYYVRPSQTFTMVQYKRMVDEDNGKVGYRPDKQCDDEVAPMWDYLKINPDPWDGTAANFRMNAMPFYMKLCPRATYDPTSKELLKGIYLPLDLWKATCESNLVKGIRGGIRLTYDNVRVRLGTSQFISLVQTGLFGSRKVTTENLRNLIRSKVDADHSVVIAEVNEEPESGGNVNEGGTVSGTGSAGPNSGGMRAR